MFKSSKKCFSNSMSLAQLTSQMVEFIADDKIHLLVLSFAVLDMRLQLAIYQGRELRQDLKVKTI